MSGCSQTTLKKLPCRVPCRDERGDGLVSGRKCGGDTGHQAEEKNSDLHGQEQKGVQLVGMMERWGVGEMGRRSGMVLRDIMV